MKWMIGLAFAGFVLAAAPAGKKMPTELERALQKLESADGAVQQEAFEALIGSRKQTVSQLISMVDDDELVEKNRNAVVLAMKALGEFRAVEAVGVLAGRFTFGRTAKWIPGRPPSLVKGDYPAAYALVLIGRPSVPAVLDVVAQRGDDGLVNFLSALFFRAIEEREGRKFARIYILEEVSKERSPRRKANLEKLLESFPKAP